MSKRFSRVTLEQWRILQAVVDHGSYNNAAEHLNKSQSTLSYSLQKMQEDLGITVLAIQGRKAVLTPEGEALLRRARRLLDDADALENSALSLAGGWESQITLNIDVICPPAFVLGCLSQFEQQHPQIRLDIVESALSGTQDAIIQGQTDIAISGIVPLGFLSNDILTIEMVCVTHPHHPLAQRLTHQPTLNESDLLAHRQIVVRDSGLYRRLDSGWLRADKRWTVNNFHNSVDLLLAGLGFAWVPITHIETQLLRGELVRLPLAHGASRRVNVGLFLPKREQTGPAAHYLSELIKQAAERWPKKITETLQPMPRHDDSL